MDNKEMEKLLASLDTVDVDDLEGGEQSISVNEAQWEKYQTVVKALIFAKRNGRGISKVEFLKAPDPLSEYASAMIVMDKISAVGGDAKAALIMAASLCDRITTTTNGDKVRTSFLVDKVWY